MRPDHWPDACPKEGDWTGLGSEKLFVTRELSVNKRRDEDLRITLRKVPAGIEITQLD